MGGEKHPLLRCTEIFNESDYIPDTKIQYTVKVEILYVTAWAKKNRNK